MPSTWTDFFVGKAEESISYLAQEENQQKKQENVEGAQQPRSQWGNVTAEYLVDEDAVLFDDEMLEMAWESEENENDVQGVEREKKRKKGGGGEMRS
jgi:hypothetical protein